MTSGTTIRWPLPVHAWLGLCLSDAIWGNPNPSSLACRRQITCQSMHSRINLTVWSSLSPIFHSKSCSTSSRRPIDEHGGIWTGAESETGARRLCQGMSRRCNSMPANPNQLRKPPFYEMATSPMASPSYLTSVARVVLSLSNFHLQS
ncbi:hypothetical protein BKA93DRAFT_106259 [Sparassis latifolia]